MKRNKTDLQKKVKSRRRVFKITIDDLKELAISYDGKCLSLAYFNTHTKYEWQCQKGHRWRALYNNVKKGSWCPKCARKKKLSIEDLQRLAESKGGKCLSTEYLNSQAKYRWKCKDGHIWEATYNSVQRGTWCPRCAGNRRLSIEDLQRLAESKGGKCLSFRYTGAYIKYRWQCEHGHQWEVSYDSVRRGSWCPQCSGKYCSESRLRLSIKDLQKLAMSRNGKCLSPECTGTRKKYRWKCKDGHIWEASYKNIQAGNWCPVCARSIVATEDLQKLAESKDGKCLSTVYLNSQTKYRWKCKEGHIWEASYNSVQQGSWCPRCAGNRRLSIEDLQKLAESRDGKCLSLEYEGSNKKYLWQCKKGHQWEAAYYDIKKGHWCPTCARPIITIEDLQRLAESKGGQCLSTEYINSRTKYHWKCKEGHTWEGVYGHIKQGRWCPVCAKKKKA